MTFQELAKTITSGYQTSDRFAAEEIASQQGSELKDLILIAMMNGTYYRERGDWFEGLRYVSENNRETALHVLVETRRKENDIYGSSCNSLALRVLPFWLILACKAAEKYGFEIPNDWVEQLKAAYTLAPEEEIRGAERLSGRMCGLIGMTHMWFKERGEARQS